MADAPWRCSECGTVNEPVANACRTCGRWPSVFDLEESKVEVVEYPPEVEPAEAPIVEAPEPEVYDVGPPIGGGEKAGGPARPLWRRLGSLIIPIAVVLYIVIRAIADSG